MVATKGIGLRTSQKGISCIGYILQQLADIFWYWIYSANNWEIYVNYGVFEYFQYQLLFYFPQHVYICIGYILPTIWGYMSIGGCRVAEYAFLKKRYTF